ncbi:MAG: DNA alkylation repair protein [Candidatus Sumerlaeaceae bacterium]
MTAEDVLNELKSLGSPSCKKMLMTNHGVGEPCFGVKIGDMKTIQKKIKKDYKLALDLYDTGNYDAMYFAGLIADDARMTKPDLQRWVNNAKGGALPGSTVAWVAAQSPHGWELGLKWIDSSSPHIAQAGWSTLRSLVALTDDSQLDLAKLKQLIQRVHKSINSAPDVVRYAMNDFLIAVGCYVVPLHEVARTTAGKIGHVSADLGNNSCQMPYAPNVIDKAIARGTPGKKRKTVKC